MSKTDNKQAQQNYGHSSSLATRIQRHLYISLTVLSLIFTSISAAHFFINDKAFQTAIQVIAYILGLTIGIILFLIAHNQRKTNHQNGLIMMISLYVILPAILLLIAYHSKILGDVGTILGIAITATLAFYEKSGKSKEFDIQENDSTPSPKFVQKNSPTSIQNNSPITIQNNNNSPISIQNNINTTHNITNTIDKKSERERDTAKACEMLASKDPTSRISGVKSLVSLADSWLDDSDPTCKKDENKCQDIIDILCAYICRPFPLVQKAIIFSAEEPPADYAGDFFIDQATFREEQNIRRTIFTEISKRSSSTASEDEGGKASLIPGTWSKFNFNFSRAPIFYPLDGLHLENSDFTDSIIYKGGEFTNTKFIGKTIFKGTRFKDSINFAYSRFINNVTFQEAHFEGGADFSEAHFEETANFVLAEFYKHSIFHWTYFIDPAYFEQAHFKSSVEFTFTQFMKNADLTHMRFDKYANFEGARFVEACFIQTNFSEVVNFRRARFYENVNFSSSVFDKQVLFNSAYFYKYAKFNAIFNLIPPVFGFGEDAAHFSIKHKCLFKVDPRSSNKIDLGKAEFKGFEYRIPVDTVLFDPESRMDHNSEYLELSEPAKRIEESDIQGETPSK